MSQWFFVRGGVQSGPVSAQQIQSMAAQGQLGPNDLIWRQGMAQWQPARTVGELFVPGAALPLPPMAASGAAPAAPVIPAYYVPPPVEDIGQDAGMRLLLPVGRSGWAIAAGYLGLLSFAGGFLGPLALICSIIAIRDIKHNPKKHGMGRAIFGLIMGILGTAALCVIIIAMATDTHHRL